MKYPRQKSANKIIKQMLKVFYEYVDRDDRLETKNRSQRKIRSKNKKQILDFPRFQQKQSLF